MKPCGDVPKSWLKDLNDLPSLPESTLKKFHGTAEQFKAEVFRRNDFLIKHSCKASYMFLSIVVGFVF